MINPLNPGFPIDITGELVIGLSFDGEISAPTVTKDGVVKGVYLDDSTQQLAKKWLPLAVEKYPTGIILVSISMAHPNWTHTPIPPVVNLHEYYPINSGVPISEWPDKGLPPHRMGYIIQWNYGGYATQEGAKPKVPSALQRHRILKRVRAQHPKYIFKY